MGWRETLEGLYKSRDWRLASAQERDAAVTDLIQVSSLAAAAVSATPVPLADVVLALPLQAAMVVAVGHVKGRDVGREQSFTIARELSTVVGTHVLAQRAFIALSRVVFPGMAGLLMAPWTFAVTWAMGRVAELYFDDPKQPAEVFKKRFKEGLKDARKAFNKEALLDFIKRQGKDVEDFAKAEKPPETTTPASETPAAGQSSSPSPPPAPPPKVVEADWEDPEPDGEEP